MKRNTSILTCLLIIVSPIHILSLLRKTRHWNKATHVLPPISPPRSELRFSLLDYAVDSLIPIPGALQRKEQLFTDIKSSVSTFQETNIYLILVDINVRSIDDIIGNTQTSI